MDPQPTHVRDIRYDLLPVQWTEMTHRLRKFLARIDYLTQGLYCTHIAGLLDLENHNNQNNHNNNNNSNKINHIDKIQTRRKVTGISGAWSKFPHLQRVYYILYIIYYIYVSLYKYIILLYVSNIYV